MNIVVITGNLGRPPRHSNAGETNERLNFSIAVNQGRGDNRRTGWLDAVMFGPGCSTVAANVEVGQELHLKGRLELSREEGFTRGADGTEYQRPIWTLVCEQFEGVTFGRKKGEGSGNGAQPATAPAGAAKAEEEIPF